MALALARRSSRSRSAPRKRRSGFDQKDMMPENFMMQQIAASGGGHPPPGMDTGGMGIGNPPPNTVPNPEVELFLQHNPVEPHGAQRLRSLPVEVQAVVLTSGSLFGARDPTAVLLSRIRAASSGIRTTRGTGMFGGNPPIPQYGQSQPNQMPPGGTGVLGMAQPSPLPVQPAPTQYPPPQPMQQQAPYQAPQSSMDMAKMWAEMNRGQGGEDGQSDNQNRNQSGSSWGSESLHSGALYVLARCMGLLAG
jgi:predicted component of type VI protein secretion system